MRVVFERRSKGMQGSARCDGTLPQTAHVYRITKASPASEKACIRARLS